MMNTTHEVSRRTFLTRSIGFAAATGAASLASTFAAEPKWPVGCRDHFLKYAGKEDSWSAMKELGAEGIEVDVSPNLDCAKLFHPQHKYTLATAEGIAVLKNDLAASGCRITAFMMSNHLDERLDEELQWTRGLVAAAQKLNIDVIRIDVVPRKLSGDAFLPFAIDACKRMCQTAEGTPIRFGVENHGKITNDPVFLEKLFDGVGSPKLGLTLDCANFYWWGHPVSDLYPLYEKFAPRAVHTHCKSIRYPEDKRNVRREMGWEYGKYSAPIFDGDIDFKRVVEILRKTGYRGDLCVEDESVGKFPAAEQGAILKKEIAMLKSLV